MEDQRSYWGVIPGEVLHDLELPPSAKLLYLVLSTMAHKNGYCWPSNATLCGELGISKRRVPELLAMLEDRGYIRVHIIRSDETGEVGKREIYCGIFATNSADTSCEISHDPPAENFTPSCEISHDPPAKNFTPSCENSHDPHEISRICYKGRNNKKENITPIAPKELLSLCENYAGEDHELLDAITGLLENRAAIKKPAKTTKAVLGILRKLDKLSGGDRDLKLAMLDNATVHNWMTVFPMKEDELPRRTDQNSDEEGEDGI